MYRDAGKAYRIVVRSELSERYAAAFEGMEMEADAGLTVFTGNVGGNRRRCGDLPTKDQARALRSAATDAQDHLCRRLPDPYEPPF
jgi:hypothetical protein